MAADMFPRWVGDVGGTNARFAWHEGPGIPLTDVATYRCAEHATLQDAMRHYLDAYGRTAPRWCAIGIANPVTGDHVQMTNHAWSFSIEAVRRHLGLERLLVINDFTALALALPLLRPDELRQVGGGRPVAAAPVGLLGAGTGLGVSGLVPSPGTGRAIPINGEGGHVTLAGCTGLEDAVIAVLRRRFGHASAERALSGPGLVNLYLALCEVGGVSAQPLSAAEITQRAIASTNAECVAALEMFFGLLGSVAGNLALVLGTRGGVYVGGGIVPKLGNRIDTSPFRERFVAKGRFRDFLEAIPTYVVHAQTSPALIGASRAIDEL